MPENRFGIGGVVLRLWDAHDELTLDEKYRPFLTNARPQIDLEHRLGDLPEQSDWEQMYDSGGAWRLYAKPGGSAIVFDPRTEGWGPTRVAVLSRDYLSGTIHTSPTRRRSGAAPFPLMYPLAEILMVNLLSRAGGVLLHACAVELGGRGVLFSGVSGAGKSTTARLWEGQRDATLLSDDRVILRRINGEFRIFGTPWHGDACVLSPRSARLEQIYVLQHGTSNWVRQLKPVEAAAKLFERSFPPVWDRAGVAANLACLAEASQALPCHELGFLPDASAVEFVRSRLLN